MSRRSLSFNKKRQRRAARQSCISNNNGGQPSFAPVNLHIFISDSHIIPKKLVNNRSIFKNFPIFPTTNGNFNQVNSVCLNFRFFLKFFRGYFRSFNKLFIKKTHRNQKKNFGKTFTNDLKNIAFLYQNFRETKFMTNHFKKMKRKTLTETVRKDATTG